MKRILRKLLPEKIYKLLRLIVKTRKFYFGYCNICGKKTIFFKTDVIDRGTMECIFCDSISRNRNICWGILKTFENRFSNLIQMVENIKDSDYSVYECAAYGPLFKHLKKMKNYFFSEFFPDKEPGIYFKGVRCEDLQKLTFESEMFDLVINEDVIEHVRKPEKAFSEIYRVLKNGGFYIFTVPIYGENTLKRVDVSDDVDLFLVEPCYHGDPLRNKGILAYNDFGTDIRDLLEDCGFKVEIYNNSIAESRIYDYVIICHKE